MEQLNDFFGKLFAYLREHPQYGLLVAILLVILYLIGLIFDWKWTLLPSGNSDFTQMWIDLFGRNAVRFVKGVLAVLLLLAIKLFYDTLAQVQDRANSLANPEYDDGCQAFLVYLEHFLYICERYPNTAAARIYKLKRKELHEIWNSWWERNEKKIPVKYRSGIKESADSMFDRLFAIKSWAVSE